jgi:TPP-dependent pyruvate/acetoin dehydrogenase alpha subunit
MNTSWSLEDLLSFYKNMYLVRAFEERCLKLSQRGLIAGSIHLCIGQEAVAVGAAAALELDDLTVTTYRGHGHVLARGVDPYPALAEILGRRTGLCKGKGGSMHLTDVARGVLVPNSIVGAGLPIAAGAALARVRSQQPGVVLCTFGEGTLNQGGAHEALNLAAIWNLPVVYLCENNQYSEMTPAYQMIKSKRFGDRVESYGIPVWYVDGMDVCAVAETVTAAVEHARSGQGPAYVEADTYRFLGHYQGDPGTGYRPAEEIRCWRERDPLALLRTQIETKRKGVAKQIATLEAEVVALLDQCEERALTDPLPTAAEIEEGLYVSI